MSGASVEQIVPNVLSTLEATRPDSRASAQQWKSWAKAERRLVRTTPWSTKFAAAGQRLVSVQYIPMQLPGAPAGVRILAVQTVYHPLHPQATPDVGMRSSLNCTSRGWTWGPLCIAAFASGGGMVIQGTFHESGTATRFGRLRLGRGGCPGTIFKTGADVSVPQSNTVALNAGPFYASNQWSSQWDENMGDHYSSGGIYACARY